MNDPIKFKLQSHANRILAIEYDDSGDYWHYVTVSDNEYGINIYDADEYGDGDHRGIRICVYPVDAVTGATNYDKWEVLETSPLAYKAFKLRNKLKESLSCLNS